MTATLEPLTDNALIHVPAEPQLPAKPDLKSLADFAVEHLKANEANIDTLIDRYHTVTVVDHHDRVSLGVAEQGRKDLKAARCKVERERKDLTKDVTAFNKAVNAEGTRLKEKVAEEEARLSKMIFKAEQAKEAEEQAERDREAEARKAWFQGRVDRLVAVGAEVDLQAVADMDDKAFELHVTFAGEVARRQRDEENRRKLQEQHEREREEQALQVERERLRVEREELERLRTEQAALNPARDISEPAIHTPEVPLASSAFSVAPGELIDAPEVERQHFDGFDEQFASDVEELSGRLRQFAASTLDDMCRPSWLRIVENGIDGIEAAMKQHHATT